jgi:hypothetical protein
MNQIPVRKKVLLKNVSNHCMCSVNFKTEIPFNIRRICQIFTRVYLIYLCILIFYLGINQSLRIFFPFEYNSSFIYVCVCVCVWYQLLHLVKI